MATGVRSYGPKQYPVAYSTWQIVGLITLYSCLSILDVKHGSAYFTGTMAWCFGLSMGWPEDIGSTDFDFEWGFAFFGSMAWIIAGLIFTT